MDENNFKTHRYTIYFDTDSDVTTQDMIMALYRGIQAELNQNGVMYCNLCVNERKERNEFKGRK